MAHPQNNSTLDESSKGDPLEEIANMFLGDEDPIDSPEVASEDTTEDTYEEDDDQSEPEESEDSEEPSGEEYTLSDVAEVLGLDEKDLSVDDDGNLMFNTKIDGETSTVSLADLKKGYQMESSVTQRSQSLAEEKKEFEAAREQVAQQVSQQMQQAEALMMVMQQELLKDYQGVDWDNLRQLDPAEYTAKRYDMEQRQQQLQQASQYTQQYAMEQQQQREKSQEAELVQQWKTMLDHNPTWSDPEVYKDDMKDLRDFASTQYGYTDEDFANVRDARAIEMLKDAAAYRKGQQVVEKKVKRKAPKLQRAKNGQFTSKKKTSKLDKLVKAAKGAKGAQKRDLEASAVSELLMNG